jgi:D-serine deaminase-like pyridoxal phosphate-dependent protein
MSSEPPSRRPAALADLNTPCLLLDRGILARNLARMAAHAAHRGIRLRPHLKTAKNADIARMAAPPPDAPVTVSTFREAEYFAHHGYRDIFYAIGFGPGKLRRAAALLRDGVRLLLLVDGVEAASAIAECARATGLPFRAAIEVDCGDRRAGLAPDDPDLVLVARALGGCFAGVATHGGQSYSARSPEALAATAAEEIGAVRAAATKLHLAGFASDVVSIGSSPTAMTDVDLRGVTELRAGVYMFWDLYQVGLGLCGEEDIAISVLTEIIGRPRTRPNEFLVDAGALALSKDTSTAALPPGQNAGYGLVCDLAGKVQPGLQVARVWQEHGLVVGDRPLPADRFRVGDRVRILPNHACITAAAHDRYFVVDGGPAITGEWPRANGW